MNLSGDPAHVGAGKKDAKVEEWKDTTADKMGGASYTDKLKNAAAGTTEYGKKLASTVYEKVAGAGTAVAGKVQHVGEIGNRKFKFRIRFIMTRIKSSMHDSNILDNMYIINLISENIIMKQI